MQNIKDSENKRLSVAKFKYPEKFLQYLTHNPNIRRILLKIAWDIMEGKQNQDAYDETLQEEYKRWLRR